jgi:TRAP-type C4-dicarboxylate transport system permease small subunit
MTSQANALFESAKDQACQGVTLGAGNGSCDPQAGVKVNNLLKTALRILSIIVGVAAVIMIIVGGFKFITSNGEAANVASARSTIIYAIVGIIVVAFAQVIVRFVLHKSSLPSCPAGQTQISKPGDCT